MESHHPWPTGNGEKEEEEAELVAGAVLDHVIGAAVEALKEAAKQVWESTPLFAKSRLFSKQSKPYQ